MRTTAAWDLSAPAAEAGDQGPLRIIDREDDPEGRTVCLIPGHLPRRIGDATFARLLDEKDLANAAMILALPLLHCALCELVEWAGHMGGWDAPCWRAAETLLQQLRAAGSED